MVMDASHSVRYNVDGLIFSKTEYIFCWKTSFCQSPYSLFKMGTCCNNNTNFPVISLKLDSSISVGVSYEIPPIISITVAYSLRSHTRSDYICISLYKYLML